MANKRRSQMGIICSGKNITLSLCMANLEKLEERLGVGLFDFFSKFEETRKKGAQFPLTIKQAIIIIECASGGKLKKKDVQKYADAENGLITLAETAATLLSLIVPDGAKESKAAKKKRAKAPSRGKNG